MNFLLTHWAELGSKVWQQIMLVGLSTLVAIIVGVSAGLFFSKHSKISHVLLSLAGIIQTIPSLALLTFLLPFLGIGLKPALTALVLYALLPILHNTLIGLQSVPLHLKQAAEGLGFTPRQQLLWVELPLALPIIIAGIKTAVVINVGVATLAAFVGAGGLGDFINRGLALNNHALILLGAIPAAILALVLDGLLSLLAHVLSHQATTPKKRTLKLTLILLSLASLILLSWWWSFSASPRVMPHSPVIRIATKNFSESIILGEMIAQTIEGKTRLLVKRDFNLGSTEICQQALLNHDIDLYPEYTGTAYLMVLHGTTMMPASALYQYLQESYATRFQLTWLVPFGFNNTYALAVREDFAKENHLTTISDLLPIANQLIAGIPSEFTARLDGLPGLQRVYRLQFGRIHEMSPALMYQALDQNQVNIISAFSTDGRIPFYHLVLLKDDKHFFPPYDAAIVARTEVLTQYPELAQALQALYGLINDQTMQHLNAQVDVKNLSPKTVVATFLQQNRVIA